MSDDDVTVAVWVDLDAEEPGMAPGTYRVGVRAQEMHDLVPAARWAASARYEVQPGDLANTLAECYREALGWVPAGAVVKPPQLWSAGVDMDLLSRACEALARVPGPLPAWREVSPQHWRARCPDDGSRPSASVFSAIGRQGQTVGWCAQVFVVFGDTRAGGPFETVEQAKAWCEREVWR